jgi:hypothetical protein
MCRRGPLCCCQAGPPRVHWREGGGQGYRQAEAGPVHPDPDAPGGQAHEARPAPKCGSSLRGQSRMINYGTYRN